MKKTKQSFKKILAILLSIALTASFLSVSSYALNPEEILIGEVTTINEWDEYKRIVSKTDRELTNLGYSADEIAAIKEFDYEEEIRNRAKLDNQTLEKYGYSTQEIRELRNAAAMDEIPENVIQSISTATMTSKLSYISSGSRTENNAPMYYVNLKFSWSWNKMPFFQNFDMVIIAFGSSTTDKFTYCVQANNKVHADLIAINSSYTNSSQVKPWVYSTEKQDSISAKFAIGFKQNGDSLSHFAYSGYGTFQLTNRSKNARLYIDSCYAHITVSITPNYTITGSGPNIGIKLDPGMDPQHCTGYFYEDFTISKNYIYHGTVYGKNNTGGTAA